MPPKSFRPIRERKQRRRTAQRQHASGDAEGSPTAQDVAKTPAVADPNAEIMFPPTAAEKAEIRRQQLKDELKVAQPKMSAKKKKRFNKYIEAKLKKEETAAILEKLAGTKVDTSLLTSTRSIGASRESKKQQVKRALLEEQAGLNLEANKAILYEEQRPVDAESFDTYLPDQTILDGRSDEEPQAHVQAQVKNQAALPFSVGVTIGVGLKRPLETESTGNPVVKRIKKNRTTRKTPILIVNELKHSDENTSIDDEGSEEGEEREEESPNENISSGEEEWAGFSENDMQEEFDSEDSATSGSSAEDSSEESDESEGKGTVSELKRGRSEKAAAFKEWALAQRRVVVDGGTEPTKSNIEASMELKSTLVHIPRLHEEDTTPPPEELSVSETDRKVAHSTKIHTPWLNQIYRYTM
jgi:ATP-dependent RNA helicase DHX37/DHR1